MQSSTFNKYRLKGAYHYDWYENQSWYKALIDRAVDFCEGTTLDIGCGEGLLVNKINSTKRGNAFGIDNDPDAVKLASTSRIKLHDVNNPILNKFEYVACLNTIEHLERPERLLEVLDDNVSKGAIISTIDYQGGSLGEDHKREYSAKQLLDFFKAYNPKLFRIEDIWIGVEIRK